MPVPVRTQNIVQIVGGSWTLEDVNVCIVFEVCERGSLNEVLQAGPSLSSARHKLSIATDVCRGMNYLHCLSPPIIHRDLKSDNVLINERHVAKVGDLGCSREVDLTRTMEVAGTPLYSAPELLRRERYDEKVHPSTHTFCSGLFASKAASGG